MYKNIYKYDEMKRGEHMAVRETVGWYLWTHQLVEVTGKDAAVFLDYIFPKNISNLKPGRERYTTMLDENAQIIDDVVVFRMEEEKFWISTLFRQMMIPWFDAHKGSYDVTYTDVTPQWEMYAVQGPKSLETVNALVKEPVDDLRFFEIKANEIAGVKGCYVNRAGFTGEKLGFELYFPKAEAPAAEAKIREAAAAQGGREVTEFQVMAWTLPTEAGFYYMRDLRHTNPFEVGLESGINFDKEFIGKEALLKIKEEGAAREVVGFTMEDESFNIKSKHLGSEGAPVMKDGECIGRVDKLVYSYVNDINNGYLIVEKGSVKNGDKVLLHGHEAVICGKNFLTK